MNQLYTWKWDRDNIVNHVFLGGVLQKHQKKPMARAESLVVGAVEHLGRFQLKWRKDSKKKGFPSPLQKRGSETKGDEVSPQRRRPHQSRGKRGCNGADGKTLSRLRLRAALASSLDTLSFHWTQDLPSAC